MFRVNGEPAIGLAIAMRDGGDILALGQNLKSAMAEATAKLPLGVHPLLVADQAVTVRTAISEFMRSLSRRWGSSSSSASSRSASGRDSSSRWRFR